MEKAKTFPPSKGGDTASKSKPAARAAGFSVCENPGPIAPKSAVEAANAIKLPLLNALSMACSAVLAPTDDIGLRRVKDGRYALRMTAAGLFQTACRPHAFGRVLDLAYTVRTFNGAETNRYYTARRAVLKAVLRSREEWEVVHLPSPEPRVVVSFKPLAKGGK